MRISLILTFSLMYMSPISADQDRGLTRVATSTGNAPAAEENTNSTTSINSGVYRAIVIGNNDYRDPKKIWRPLNTAVNDAKEFARILRENYGFQDVELMENATRQQILKSINKMTERTKPEDNVLVYYAGHGWRNEKTQEAYWIPVDAEGDDDSFYLSNVRIKEKLSVIASNASHTLLISDSCFSGSLLDSRSKRDIPLVADDRSYYRKVSQRRSVQILAAGGKEYVDDNYLQSGHSPFTYFLINELKLNDQEFLTLSSLALRIEELVAKNAQQTPQSGAMRMAGDEGGQFVFFKVNAVSPTPALAHHSSPPLSSAPATASRAEPSVFQSPATTASDNDQQSQLLAMLQAQDTRDAIEELFEKASKDITFQRFSMPKGNSALDRYLTVLVLDGNNSRARTAIRQLFTETTNTVKRHIFEHQVAQARKYLFQAERIDPSSEQNNRVVERLRIEIDALGRDNPNVIDSGITVIRH